MTDFVLKLWSQARDSKEFKKAYLQYDPSNTWKKPAWWWSDKDKIAFVSMYYGYLLGKNAAK